MQGAILITNEKIKIERGVIKILDKCPHCGGKNITVFKTQNVADGILLYASCDNKKCQKRLLYKVIKG